MADLLALEQMIQSNFEKTNSKIESIQTTINEQIDNIRGDVTAHSGRLTKLEEYATTDAHRINSMTSQIEILKQDRLRNNIRLTGLPPQAFEDAVDTVMRIIDYVKIKLIPSDFIAYSDRNQASIIVIFDYHSHKRYFMDALRKQRELIVEEVLQIRSNSKIYCNDQLTPFYASLFQKAWQAKKTNQLYSASSLGGRIKVRKTENSSLKIIQDESELNDVINGISLNEVSSNSTSESPNSHSNKQLNQTNQLLVPESELPAHQTKQKTQQSIEHTAPQRERGANRQDQWQGMRQRSGHRNNYPKQNNRYQQQDRTRQIDLSPGQYRHSDNRGQYAHGSQGSHRGRGRGYQPNRFNERY